MIRTQSVLLLISFCVSESIPQTAPLKDRVLPRSIGQEMLNSSMPVTGRRNPVRKWKPSWARMFHQVTADVPTPVVGTVYVWLALSGVVVPSLCSTKNSNCTVAPAGSETV